MDNFQPGKMIPSCQLKARFVSSHTITSEIPSFQYCVKLLGAKEPYNEFNIIPSTTATTNTEKKGIFNFTTSYLTMMQWSIIALYMHCNIHCYTWFTYVEIASNENHMKPKLKDLLSELLTKVASKWMNIGILLDIEQGKLKTVKADHGSDSESCLREMLQIWLNQVEPSPTWSAMAKAIKSVGNPELASDLRTKYCRTNA